MLFLIGWCQYQDTQWSAYILEIVGIVVGQEKPESQFKGTPFKGTGSREGCHNISSQNTFNKP